MAKINFLNSEIVFDKAIKMADNILFLDENKKLILTLEGVNDIDSLGIPPDSLIVSEENNNSNQYFGNKPTILEKINPEVI